MDIYAQIKQKIKEIVGSQSAQFHIATVKSIQGDTCTVQLGGSLTLTEVRLRSVVNEENSKLLITPKVESNVLIADLSSQLTELIIIAYSEIEKIEAVTDSIKFTNLEETLTVEFDGKAKKIDIKNDSVSLTSLMQSVASIIENLTISTPSGPSGTPLPPTVQAVSQFKTDFEKLLK